MHAMVVMDAMNATDVVAVMVAMHATDAMDAMVGEGSLE